MLKGLLRQPDDVCGDALALRTGLAAGVPFSGNSSPRAGRMAVGGGHQEPHPKDRPPVAVVSPTVPSVRGVPVSGCRARVRLLGGSRTWLEDHPGTPRASCAAPSRSWCWEAGGDPVETLAEKEAGVPRPSGWRESRVKHLSAHRENGKTAGCGVLYRPVE